MNFKIKISSFVVAVMLVFFTNGNLLAQQDPMYTQYMDNLQIVNPGFAGSEELAGFMLITRNQWVSFDGAPRSRTLSFRTPVKNYKIGLGFSLLTDRIGPLNRTGIYFDYSYFLRVGMDYKLGMGIKGGFSFYRAALTDLQTVSPDPIYSRDIYRNFLPNFGIGAFLFSDKNYFGISAPKLVENTISRVDYSSEYVNKEKMHFYVVAGKIFKLNNDFEIKSHSMLKVVKNVPLSMDVTAMLGIRQRFWVGGMYRIGDSYGFLAQFSPTKEILIGYSYDLTYSELNAFNNGTHEIMLSYSLNLLSGGN